METEKPFGKTGRCVGCNIERRFILHIQLAANASQNFVWVCSVCNRRNPSSTPENRTPYYISGDTVRQHLSEDQIQNLPVIMPDMFSRCVRCGSRDAELHHWAPKGIFGNDEAEMWPKDYLCKSCHDQWHRMVTPQLVK